MKRQIEDLQGNKMGDKCGFYEGVKVSLLTLGLFGSLLQGGKCESAGIANGNGTKVYSRILETHNPIIPPAVNMTIPILLYLSQLRKVDTLNQIMITNIHLEVYWHDPSLVWDASEALGMKYVSLPPSKIWTPKLTVFNSVEQSGVSEPNILTGGNTRISPEGHVTWHIYTTLHSACTVDVTYYPFDQQTCTIKIGALEPAYRVKPAHDVHFALLDEFYLSVEWSVIEMPAYLNIMPGKEGDYPENDVTYYFTLRRCTHWISQVYPSLALGLLTMIPCLLCPTRFLEKLLIQLFCLVGISVVYWDSATKLPPTTVVTPHIFQYLLPLTILNFIHLILTCLLNRFETGGRGSNLKSRLSQCAPKLVWDKIYKNFSGLKPTPAEMKENLNGVSIESQDDTKETGGRSNGSSGRWLCFTHSIIFIALLLGVSILIGKFLCDAPYVSEKVDQRKIAETYSAALGH